MPALQHPYYPIIYVRGYAMTQEEIENAVADPHMGFNLGSTKIKQAWDRSIGMHIFESPLVRLMKDYRYQDSFRDGKAVEGAVPARSIHIYRYYDQASQQIGSDKTPSIQDAATGLSQLILKVRDQVCGDDAEARASFKVYLVAHSMGGLVCRCFLQNSKAGLAEARQLVDKVFTYGTPHNGIDVSMLGFSFNVPSWFGAFDANNFSRTEMRNYLELPKDCERVDSLNGCFDPARFFCLVGTDHRDYTLARFAVGEMSDGLVKIENAAVAGSPRAYVYRSHSGQFGLVNSEEGYQNLTRFLFGDTFVTGELEIDALPLPPRVAAAKEAGKQVRASYLFEATVTPRGAFNVNLTERCADDSSAIFRTFDELLRPANLGRDKPRSPVLFSVFLDSKKIEVGNTLVFGIKLTVRSTDYTVLDENKTYPAETLFDEHITIRATVKPDGGWRLRYVLSNQWSEVTGRDIPLNPQTGVARLSLENGKGFSGTLLLDFSLWNRFG
ncbi:MAG: hypothetical protein LBV44_09900 [Methylobacillus sp.]|jgi:hypothetical protein|nr:hypothetical protein [Methylobacillus sp.]